MIGCECAFARRATRTINGIAVSAVASSQGEHSHRHAAGASPSTVAGEGWNRPRDAVLRIFTRTMYTPR